MKEPPSQRFQLSRGQSLHIYASRGMHIVAVRGALQVRFAPRWLGEQMVVQEMAVYEGDAHVVQCAGPATVFAPAEAEVRCVSVAAGARCAGLLRALIERACKGLAGICRHA
jgi:hypothetical protein